MEFVHVCNRRLGLIFGSLALLLAAFAPAVVSGLAPGLLVQHHHAAVCMLRVMAPVVALSGVNLVLHRDTACGCMQARSGHMCTHRAGNVTEAAVQDGSVSTSEPWS